MDKEKKQLFTEIKDYLNKINEPDKLDPKQFASIVVNDCLHKSEIDTMQEIEIIRKEFKNYDFQTGEKIELNQ